MGAYYTFFPFISMCYNLHIYVEISTNKNDTYWTLHIFRNFLEFLSIRIQMCANLQNNINQFLYSRIILCDYRSYMLDHRTWNV